MKKLDCNDKDTLIEKLICKEVDIYKSRHEDKFYASLDGVIFENETLQGLKDEIHRYNEVSED